MADNVQLSAPVGLGSVIATDDDGTAQHQYVKLEFGPDNTQTKVTTAVGLPVVQQTGASFAVTGTFWQATQPVSLASVPSHDVTNAGTFAVQAAQAGAWNITNISGTVSLPTGAATAAKQPALGTAGTASTDVITVQGIASMTALKVDGSAVTQPANITQLGGNAIATGSGVTGTGVQRVTLATDVALPSGTNVLGGVNQNGTWTVQPGNTANTTPWIFKLHDGTNAMAAFFDLDTGAGAQYLPGFNIRISANGGSIEAKGQQAMASSIPVVIASDQGTFTVAATQSGTWNIGTVTTVTTVATVTSLTQFNGNAIDTNSGNKSAGTLRVVLATDQPQLANKLLVTPDAGATVQDIPATSGGLSIYSFLSTNAVQAAAIKASAGQVYAIEFFNSGATPVYVRLYNQTTSPGTGDTPVWRGLVPGNTAGAGFVKTWDKGLAFGTGIGIRVTAAVADNDNTALTANGVIGNVEYK